MRNLLRWDPFRDAEFNLELHAPFTPSFDIRETSEGYVFEADMPGIREEDLDLHLAGNRLTVTGKRESASRKDTDTFFTLERSFGSFSRSFNLPDGVDGTKVQAELNNGVLTLRLAKLSEVQNRRIPLSSAKQDQPKEVGVR
jgi:HSP20 family protein